MNIKLFTLFLFIIYTSVVFAQDTSKVIFPDKSYFNEYSKTKNLEAGKYYLDKYYSKKGPLVKIKLDTELNEHELCEWKQKYEDGIYYHFNSCGEGGELITITFTNIKLEDAINLVDKLFKSSENKWNKSKTKLIPKDELAGCYYEIKQINNYVIIEYYCGC